MKTIGLIGGMSWESTAVYYRMINEEIRRRLGGLNSAKLLMESLNFTEIVAMQRRGAWGEAACLLTQAARRLERSGADVVAICTNTMHKLAPDVEAGIEIPLLHIADVTRQAVREADMDTVGLLGTRYTMEQAFLRERLSRGGGPNVLIPVESDLDTVHNIIFSELCQGHIRGMSRDALLEIIDGLRRQGAQGIILGCTELMLILAQEDSPLPIFDTTMLHSRALVDFALAETPAPTVLREESLRLDSVLSIA